MNIAPAGLEKARDMVHDLLKAIPDLQDRLEYAERWDRFFSCAAGMQAEAQAFREAAEVMKIFLKKP